MDSTQVLNKSEGRFIYYQPPSFIIRGQNYFYSSPSLTTSSDPSRDPQGGRDPLVENPALDYTLQLYSTALFRRWSSRSFVIAWFLIIKDASRCPARSLEGTRSGDERYSALLAHLISPLDMFYLKLSVVDINYRLQYIFDRKSQPTLANR